MDDFERLAGSVAGHLELRRAWLLLAEIYIQSSKYDLASSLCHLAKACTWCPRMELQECGRITIDLAARPVNLRACSRMV